MRKLAAVLAGLLAATLLPTLTAPAQATGPHALQVVRQYGDGPVTVPRRVDRVVIAFAGRRGDRVRVIGTTCQVRVWRGSQELRAGAAGFVRLPARARYEARWHRCVDGTEPKLQLQELRTHRLRPDGPMVQVRRHRGYVQGITVVVPDAGRVQVTSLDDDWFSILLPDGTRYASADCWQDDACEEPGPVFLEAGRPLGGWEGPYAVGRDDAPYVLRAGDRVVLLVRAPTMLVARTTVLHPSSLDGDAVRLRARPHQEAALAVGLEAGQWVRVEEVAGPTRGHPVLLQPDGTQVPGPWDPGLSYWQAPETGTYRVVFQTWTRGIHATVRLRTMREVATPLPIDGTPVDYPVTTPGEWLVAPVVPGASGLPYQLAGSASAGATGWFASVERRARFYCSIYGPLGCGDWAFDHVDAGRPGPSPTLMYGVYVYYPSVVVVGMASDVTGTVTASLALAPRSPSVG